VRFFFDDDRSQVNYTVDIKGHSGSAVTGAAIHRGAPGENGPVVFELAGPDFIVTSGRLTLTSEQLDAFASGAWYVTLSTTFHPEGEIRGQISVPEGFLPGQAAPRAPQAPSGSPGTIRPPDTGDAGLR
jgi:hypothetical protein